MVDPKAGPGVLGAAGGLLEAPESGLFQLKGEAPPAVGAGDAKGSDQIIITARFMIPTRS